jgi:hypothetical protein
MSKVLYLIPIIGIVIFVIYAYYSHSFSSNDNNYSLSDPTLYDKKTCFSTNDKLVDTNNNNWTHVFENVKTLVVVLQVIHIKRSHPLFQ